MIDSNENDGDDSIPFPFFSRFQFHDFIFSKNKQLEEKKIRGGHDACMHAWLCYTFFDF